jgi:predicted ArsR family transcriptional regulator
VKLKLPLSLDEVKDLPKEKGAGISTEELVGKLTEEAFSTAEVAEALGVKTATARAKLGKLFKEGLITRGYDNKTIYWYVES